MHSNLRKLAIHNIKQEHQPLKERERDHESKDKSKNMKTTSHNQFCHFQNPETHQLLFSDHALLCPLTLSLVLIL